MSNHTGLERRMMYSRGFGDGAKCSYIRFPDDPDYKEGWHDGRDALNLSTERFRLRESLPTPNILRVQNY